MDHVVFRQNGYIALRSKDKGPENQAVQVNVQECRLGVWYHQGSGRKFFGHTAAYKRLHNPHQAVHYHIQQALIRSDADWQMNE